MPPVQNDDPITGKSLSGPILLATIVLLLVTFWSLYDEVYTTRPWKNYQQRFIQVYSEFLQKKIPEQAEAEQRLRNSAAYQRLQQQIEAAEQQVASRVQEIDSEIRILNRRINALQDVFMVERARVGAQTYQAEVSSERRRESLLTGIEEMKQVAHAITLPVPDGSTETVSWNYVQMNRELEHMKARKSERILSRVDLLAPAGTLRIQLDDFKEEKLAGLSQQALEGLLNKMRTFKVEIKQIHIKDGDLVERCESCHLGIREPLTLTAADLGGEQAFISHPNPDLLAVHDPELFGCSPCHNGNGRATSSVVKGHGRNEFWLWPLYDKENTEAGCQQCHRNDFVLDHAETLNRGKEIYRLYGCIGCHRYEGFDNQDEQLAGARNEILLLTNRRHSTRLEIDRSIQAGDRAETNQEASRLYQRAENLRVSISDMDARVNVLEARSAELLKEIKKTGPNLKDLKVKVRPEWIPVWLRDPHQWRPTTKMPAFPLEENEVQAISAYVWQNATDTRLPRQPRGNARRGQQLFETRGCLACHSMGEGEQRTGGQFAANLSRVGEKANYDFLVRWVHNPRERLRPYCPFEERDLTPEDYAQHGLPFEWSLEGATCPNDGHQLMVMNQTVMPSLRLAQQDARDIASYLVTKRRPDAPAFPKADFINDAELARQGKDLIRHYGCAGCHEISGFETEPRIGTELTFEGSKPIERLDFALKTHEAEREGWYNHKGFFENKLRNPAFFDEGKIRDPLERLRMPKPNIDENSITAVTTFLLGSVNPTVPEAMQNLSEGTRQDIQEGWRLATKYNCMGCHQIRIGKDSTLMGLPFYQSNPEALPPSLMGAGARLNPDWLTGFLKNPALSTTNTNRNGIRSYLDVRMPTFYLSNEEIRKLTRFFQAASSQPMPFIPTPPAPLSDRERRIARQLFTNPAAPCLKCHATGDPMHDRNATAPNFLSARARLKDAWTKRWLIDPASISPGTAMPSGLFRQEGGRWVFAGPLPPSVRNYQGDHVDLLVRYMLQLTPAEQRSLVSRMAAAPPRSSRMVAALLKSH